MDSNTDQNGFNIGCCFYGWLSAPCGAGCVVVTGTFLLRAKQSHSSAAAETPESAPTPPTALAADMWRDEF